MPGFSICGLNRSAGLRLARQQSTELERNTQANTEDAIPRAFGLVDLRQPVRARLPPTPGVNYLTPGSVAPGGEVVKAGGASRFPGQNEVFALPVANR
jgi:hypothetical protein